MQKQNWKEEAGLWYDLIKTGLLSDVLEFWKGRTADRERGGYITSFDRKGKCIGIEKNVWLHARQVWMFSVIYQEVERDPVWLELAKMGRDYLVSHAYAGGGRWYYLLDEIGNVEKGTISLYTDMFVLMALGAYAEASGKNQDCMLIKDTFETLCKNVRNDACEDLFPQVYEEGCIYHGRYMICLNAVARTRNLLNQESADQLIRYCMDRIFEYLGYEDDGVIHEIRTLQKGRINREEGHWLNPGHIFESMWFVAEEADRLGLEEYKKRALYTIGVTYDMSHDTDFGGIFHMLDDRGYHGGYQDWNHNRNLQWDEKVWWTHAEALCALLTAAGFSDDDRYWKEFKDLYLWCHEHFYDAEYGEWFAVLKRDGTPRIMDKGGLQKAAFHVPRALYQCLGILKKIKLEAGKEHE